MAVLCFKSSAKLMPLCQLEFIFSSNYFFQLFIVSPISTGVLIKRHLNKVIIIKHDYYLATIKSWQILRNGN